MFRLLRTFLLTAIIIVVIIFIGKKIYDRHFNVLPINIKKVISFQVYWPLDQYSRPEITSIKYATTQSVLSFNDKFKNQKIVFTEQSTPSVFNDVNGYYSALISHSNNYNTISTKYGQVFLTKPPSYPGAESAVMNSGGTLLFATVQGDISSNDWQLIFNNLKVILN